VSVVDADADATGQGQRERILEIALRLMSENGVHAMSMRRLADACGLNVATIYHYFPSKADLLTQVIAHRSYEEMLADLPPVETSGPPRERMRNFLVWIWSQVLHNEDMWRLLLGESLRGEAQAMQSAAALSDSFEQGLEGWFAALFPDVAIDHGRTARVVRVLVYGFIVEQLPLEPGDRLGIVEKRADDVAAALLPE
jgi:AcrR family transcriptional regulator